MPTCHAELALPLWPFSQAEEALTALAKAAGLGPLETGRPAESPAAPHLSADRLGAWLDEAAPRYGLEAPGVVATGGELTCVLQRASPGLFYVSHRGLLALLSASRSRLTLLGPDLQRWTLRRSRVEQLICEEAAAAHRPAVCSLLRRLQLSARRRAQLEHRLLAQRLSAEPVATGWLLRQAPGGPLRGRGHRASILYDLTRIGIAYLLSYACGLLAILLLGRGALGGRLDVGWLLGSLLLIALAVALRFGGVAVEERLGSLAGALLKERLLLGALRADSLMVRQDGIGRILGRILEAESLEWLISGGGLALLLGGLELLWAALLLAAVPGGRPLLILLAVYCAAALGLSIGFLQRYRGWAAARLSLSARTIESMVGHRTRLVQLPVGDWHKDEDAALAGYQARSQALDRVAMVLHGVLPRGWLLVSLLGLMPQLLWVRAVTPELAVLLWVVLLSSHSFGQLGAGLLRLGGVLVAWEQVSPLLTAAALEPAPPAAPAEAFSGSRPEPPGAPLLRASGLSYAAPGRNEPLLRDCELAVATGQRLLLEGPSGSGKSTLAAILAGLRAPAGGLLLLHGLDLHSLGPQKWRRRVALAPQFHDNHILTASLAFNLLLGRAWPPQPADLVAARELCEALGLGPLLARMPGGLHQQVGETGWRLSQGERSRVYLARTLLQRADLLILDESLAALDPETLRQVSTCLLQCTGALLLIAHP